MRKPHTMAVTIFAAGMMLAGSAMAQQTPASNPQQAQAAKAPAAKTPATTTAAAKTPAAKSDSASVLKTQKDKESYAVGLNIGKSMHHDSLDVDPAILSQGIKDGLTGSSKTLMTDDEVKAALTALQDDVRNKQAVKLQQEGEINKKEGDAFLAANKTKDGVVTLPSGLEYKILQQGTGPKPTASDTVVCNYKGTLISGKEFDSSYTRGMPATFPVGQVIKGWTEALQLMPVGSKWQLFLPSDLAYGERSPSDDIGPNSTLIFEVELISIQGKTK